MNQYYGVTVLLTHDGVNFPNNDAGDLAARAMIARNHHADLYVSLHINDTTDKNVEGAYVYVTSRTELPKYKEGMTILGNKILNNLNKLGIHNNGVINDKLCQDHEPKYQYYDGSQADYYADIRHAMRGDTLDDLGDDFRDGSGIPTVLIEHCYMNNSHDVTFLDSEEDLKKLAKADGEAIIDYLQLRPKGQVVESITLDKEKVNLLPKETAKVTATVGPNTVKNKAIKWTSNNEKVATVDQEGKITAVSVGKANITATSVDNPNVEKVVNVNIEDERVKFTKEKDYILVGDSKILDVTISPSWIKNKELLWESNNKNVIEVSQEGKITAKQEGSATIKITWKEQNLSDEIEVTAVKLDENTKMKIENYKLENNDISGIGQKVTLKEFLSHIVVSNNLEVVIEMPNQNQEYVGTNTKVTIKEKKYGFILKEYVCFVYGDINGDGKISSLDYTLIKNHIMEVKEITDSNMKLVADVNRDNKISSLDYTLIKNDIMDIKKLPIR